MTIPLSKRGIMTDRRREAKLSCLVAVFTYFPLNASNALKQTTAIKEGIRMRTRVKYAQSSYLFSLGSLETLACDETELS